MGQPRPQSKGLTRWWVKGQPWWYAWLWACLQFGFWNRNLSYVLCWALGSHVRFSSWETGIGARGRMKGERFISLKKMEVLLHRESTISPRLTDKGSSSPTTAGTHVVGFLPHWILHPRDHRQLVTPLGIGRREIFGNTSMHRTSRREKLGSSCSSAMERCGDVPSWSG